MQKSMGRIHGKSLAIGIATVTGGLMLSATTVRAALVQFDDVTTSSTAAVPSGYDGFVWTNFYAVKYNFSDGFGGPSGYDVADVSPQYAALNGFGNASSISLSSGGFFNLSSLFLTAAFNDGLSVSVTGLSGSATVYSQVLTPSATSPTLETLNFNDVTEVTFTSSGGTPHAGYTGTGEEFAVDNISVSAVPEPIGLGFLSAVAMLAVRRRKSPKQSL